MGVGTTDMVTKLVTTTDRVVAIPLTVMITEEKSRMVVIGAIMTATVDVGDRVPPGMVVTTMTITVEGVQAPLEDLDMEVSLSFREGDMVPTSLMFRLSSSKTSIANLSTG
jgi:hypothetical protein